MYRTGVVWDPIFAEHDMGALHPESPSRILAIADILNHSEAGKKTIRLKAEPATKDEIAWVHDPRYIDFIEGTKGKTVPLDSDTTASPRSYEAACMAAGGTIECVEAVLTGEVNNAYALVRPPGHHAEKARAMGFCFFNNIAIAAEYAVRKHDLKKVAIVDFDVHHGNGTQNAFYSRSDVFYISTHRWPFYPGSGRRDERGEGKGIGYTLNIPFSAGADDTEFRRVYADVVIPVVEEYNPELILVSAGYDAHKNDPLGGLYISTDSYNWLMRRFVGTALKCCDGKIVIVLEGGYDIGALRDCVEGALNVLLGGLKPS